MQAFQESGIFPLRGTIGRRSAERGRRGTGNDRVERAWRLLEEVRATYRRHPNKINRRQLADAIDRFHEAYGLCALPSGGARARRALSANGIRR